MACVIVILFHPLPTVYKLVGIHYIMYMLLQRTQFKIIHIKYFDYEIHFFNISFVFREHICTNENHWYDSPKFIRYTRIVCIDYFR